MPDEYLPTTIKLHSRIREIGREGWDALARASDPTVNPFVSYDFLDALEVTGCVDARTGWLPRHITAWDSDGALVAAAPMYVKGHSYGEFVFDHAWADAYERAGGKYYPKLLCAVPFSPVPGPRLLTYPENNAHRWKGLLLGMIEAARKMEVSSVHINFLPRDEWMQSRVYEYVVREGRQFHWFNDGYDSFEHFLGTLSSRKRKNLRKERERAVENVEVRRLTGTDIRPEHWDAFYRFYMNTTSRKWGSSYLNHAFFQEMGGRLAARVLLVMAFRDGRPVAGALNLFSDEAVFGRNWGCTEEHPFLHFECCYYQAIDFAIERGLKRVEAGAGGHHKLSRGYVPVPTYSTHWIADEGFRDALERYLEIERDKVGRERHALSTHAPFRKGNDGPAPDGWTHASDAEGEDDGF
jgi:hypothetical protein